MDNTIISVSPGTIIYGSSIFESIIIKDEEVAAMRKQGVVYLELNESGYIVNYLDASKSPIKFTGE